MKKEIKIVTLLFAMSSCLFGCGDNKVVDYSELEEVSITCDTNYYDYSELGSEADIICKVEVLDNLTAKNSEAQYMDIDKEKYLVSAISRRKVRVLEYYKNDKENKKDELEILEGAAIIDNCYYHDDGYNPLQKGNTYILYLSNDTASGEYSLISGLNSVIDVSNPLDNKDYADIAAKTLVNYESDMSKSDKKEFVESDIEVVDDIASEKKEEVTIAIGTDNSTEEVELTYQKEKNKILVEK